MRAAVCLCFAVLIACPAAARAGGGGHPSCLEALSDLGVHFSRVHRKGIEVGVRIRGPIGGVEFVPFRQRPLIIDCSLAYSLARSAPIFEEHGIERVIYSSAYDRRNIRGTHRLSHHSFGLAIDVHTFSGPELERLRVRDDYEQGLGQTSDCLGEPLTEGGAILRDLACQLEASELFRIILTPDYDAHHYNHFHLEALPWEQR